MCGVNCSGITVGREEETHTFVIIDGPGMIGHRMGVHLRFFRRPTRVAGARTEMLALQKNLRCAHRMG